MTRREHSFMSRRLVGLVFALLLAGDIGLAGQQTPAPAGGAVPVTYKRLPANEAAVLELGNRPIVTFRAEFLTRSPRERADAASRRFAAIPVDRVPPPVSQRSVLDLIIITVAGNDLFTVTSADADELAGETQVQVAVLASRQVEQALRERLELRQPARLARAGGIALGFTLLLIGALWVLRRVYRALGVRMQRLAAHQIERTRLDTHVAVDASRFAYWLERGLRTIAALLALVAVYVWLTSVFVLFPYTRPWGEALGAFLARMFARLGGGIIDAIPGLFYASLIFLLTRFVIRVVGATLDGVAEGRLHLPGIHPETAVPSKRLLAGLLWLFAVIVSYPYLPGSQTDAFKGVSVFVGLVLTIGSSGLVTHMMSGFLLTFTRTIKSGDYVRAGDTEGTVTMVGLFSTKVKTLKGEEVVLPNAVAIGGAIVNYSRYANEGALLVYTSVTIGYDTPWRQVEALLRDAAGRTQGLSESPPPFVLQRALSDFYVEYQINAALAQPETRARVLSALHAHIQDAFNAAGVQIMSPHYERDPAAPKLVHPEQWERPAASGA
jgi:small-conductance mechanosensitive channel